VTKIWLGQGIVIFSCRNHLGGLALSLISRHRKSFCPKIYPIHTPLLSYLTLESWRSQTLKVKTRRRFPWMNRPLLRTVRRMMVMTWKVWLISSRAPYNGQHSSKSMNKENLLSILKWAGFVPSPCCLLNPQLLRSVDDFVTPMSTPPEFALELPSDVRTPTEMSGDLYTCMYDRWDSHYQILLRQSDRG